MPFITLRELLMNKLTLMAAAIFFSSTAYAQNSQMISSGSQFNPSISLILDGNYYHDNKKGKAGRLFRRNCRY
jgi:hypothetical protein